MKPTTHIAVAWLSLLLLLALGQTASADGLVVRADRLHTGAGPVLEDAVVVADNGVVVSVSGNEGADPPPGARVLRAAVVTPGFIDVHTSAGLSGLRNVPAVRDANERTDPDQAALRAIDGFDARDPLLRYLLEQGVTLVQTGPGPTTPIAGQAGIFRTHGTSADAMAVRFPSALVFNLGETPKRVFSKKDEAPTTRMATAALIRARLLAGRAYASKHRGWFGGDGDGTATDPGLEVLGRVASGELPAIFTAHRADDILTVARLARELGLDAVVAGATEGYVVRDALRAEGLPVFVGPVMERVSTPEKENASYENAALLAEAGVPIAIRTGFEGYVPKNRVLRYEAAIAAANGLGPDPALHAITLGAAKLLGVDDDYGSIEKGKVADLVLFDGDPFEYATHVTAVIVGGEVVFER